MSLLPDAHLDLLVQHFRCLLRMGCSPDELHTAANLAVVLVDEQEPPMPDVYALARLMHLLFVQETQLYATPAFVETSWAADGANRRLWIERARRLEQGLRALDQLPPSTVLTAAVLADLLAQTPRFSAVPGRDHHDP